MGFPSDFLGKPKTGKVLPLPFMDQEIPILIPTMGFFGPNFYPRMGFLCTIFSPVLGLNIPILIPRMWFFCPKFYPKNGFLLYHFFPSTGIEHSQSNPINGIFCPKFYPIMGFFCTIFSLVLGFNIPIPIPTSMGFFVSSFIQYYVFCAK